MKFFQRLGRSLMLPVAVLPVAAILSGIGYWIENAVGEANLVSAIFSTAGGALLDNLALLFAIGVSIGMARKTDGTSALAGLVSWLVITTMLNPDAVAVFQGIEVDDVNPAFANIENAFTGIIAGLIGAACYNRFKDVKLPDWLSFFSGKRSVAIVTAAASLILALVLYFVWPFVYGGLVGFGEWIVTLGAFGTGIYGFLNRLLIPFGLHHALNSVFWFDVAGINDLNNFLAGEGTYGVTGQYMTGFFPIMMLGLPGAALAMYVTAKTKRKKIAAGILLSAAVSSFFVGVTEPLEFSFMFLAPWLYVVHALFTGISMAIATILPVRMGFGFSGGFIDLVLGWVNPMAENPWMIFVLGAIWFVIYFLVFRWLILRFRLKTPGREDDEDVQDEAVDTSDAGYLATGAAFIEALGGKENILELDNCATRLRMEIGDTTKVDEQALKRAGATGTMKAGGQSVQVVYGLNVQFVKDAMEQVMAGAEVPTTAPAAPAAPAGGAVAVAAPPRAVVLRQPIAGTIVPLSEVPDEAFAQATLGPGVAVEPTGDTVVAPGAGRVETIFPTGHAVGLVLDDGTEVLIHIGLDTVEMGGDGFEALVSAGDVVDEGTPLVRVDLAKVRAAGHPTVTPIVVLNAPDAVVGLR
ncbi:N-acetylglucosamine-specific PTS transporter subunit IIBC [Microbacterium halophytorum]|uniref:N-acetylglucosamine-specific PTS transporter subunit IIBC n=1 Tax=Microbacterium halophytorum TaxID=2067568 RepID=UPI000CFB9475|nr:N-acetylglucosamine-specific PTS transporter subunit IIBC [Microbacterium halophytorum]